MVPCGVWPVVMGRTDRQRNRTQDAPLLPLQLSTPPGIKANRGVCPDAWDAAASPEGRNPLYVNTWHWPLPLQPRKPKQGPVRPPPTGPLGATTQAM